MKSQSRTNAILVNALLVLIVVIWSIPTFGLFISSFRNRFDIQTSGWWTVFPHREWETVLVVDPKELNLDPDSVMTVEDVQGTFEQLREGVTSPDGDTQVIWVGNKRLGRIEVQKQVWTVTWDFTLDNYKQILIPTSYEITKADGTTEEVPGQNMTQAFLNSLAVAIPSTIIPPDRCVCRLRICLDEIPRSATIIRDDRWVAGRPAADRSGANLARL